MKNSADQDNNLNNKNIKHKFSKSKDWWDDELENNHKTIKNSYKLYKDSNFRCPGAKMDLKISTTSFRNKIRKKKRERF